MRICSVEGCGRDHSAKGFCSVHYLEVRRRSLGIPVKPKRLKCSMDGCEKLSHAKGYCYNHYSILKRNGDPGVLRRKRNGEGCLDTTHGYRLIFVDGKQQKEHRVVASRKLGRPLNRNEIVHHKDGDKLNNHPDNLEVMTQSEHMRLHYEQGEGLRKVDFLGKRIHDAVEFLKKHAPEKLKEP